VLRNVVAVTVAAPPDSTVKGTDEPSLRSSAPVIVTVPPIPPTSTGEFASTHPPSTVILPEVTDTADPVSVPPDRLSVLPEVPLSSGPAKELSIRETIPAKIKLPPSISTLCIVNCPPSTTLI
jgi:hypothetical protein